MALTRACSSNAVVGKWTALQRCDLFEQTWKPVEEDAYLEFSNDGKYKATVKGKLTSGTYRLDETVNPYRMVLDDEKEGRVNMIFRLEGHKLTLKVNKKDADSQFSTDLETGEGDDDFELVEFERK